MLTRRGFGLGVAIVGLAGSAAAQTAPPQPFYPNHPQYATAADMLNNNRWADLVATLSALPPASAVVLLEDLGQGSPLRDNLDALARVRGGKTVAGAIQIGWAWRYRGAGTTIVNEDAFGRQLVRAADLLATALSDDANDGVAAMYLMRCLKGGGEKKDLEALLPIYLASRRKPVQGLSQYADAISEKWMGTDAECLAFARQYAGSAAPASYGVVPWAHFVVRDSHAMSDDAQIQQSAPSYFTNADVTAEIITAHEHFLAAPADSDNFAMQFAHAEFSYVFLTMNDMDRLRVHLAGQGEFIGGPWIELRDPHGVLLHLRSLFGLSAG
ncbi:MAG: hypothetical protein ABUS57_14960 [Pseudomonadota bacterium]